MLAVDLKNELAKSVNILLYDVICLCLLLFRLLIFLWYLKITFNILLFL